MIAFNEDSRVKFPTILHCISMGYDYVPANGFNKIEYDQETNILIEPFKSAFNKLNPTAQEGDWNKALANIQNKLYNDDLGREFYEKILLNPGTGRIIDLSTPENFYKNNTFQVSTEMTCGKKDEDNFRPDITLFINGLPLAFIEVKKQNNHTGITAESERMKMRFQTKPFRRYLNITQIMVFSNDMEYNDDNIEPTQGAFYAAIGRFTTKYNCFREEGQRSFPIHQAFRKVTDEMEDLVLRDNHVPTYKRSSSSQLSRDNNDTPTKRMVKSLFSFDRFYFLLKYGIAYVNEPNGLQKHIMRYPQIFATKAIEQYLEEGKTKGIIWHTQGSGKTALAFFNVKYLTDYYAKQGIIAQFFFIVDRIDLLIQAQAEFEKRGLRVKTVLSKDDFKTIIKSQLTTFNAEGQKEITVVNIQKFSDDSHATNKNDYNLNVKRIYFIDEAHRDYKPNGCFLKNLIASDENSIKIALTGTPIISGEYNTKEIFGDYIHTYYYNASIADGYTLRLMREVISSNFMIEMQSLLQSIKVRENTVTENIVKSHPNYVSPMLDYIIDDLHNFRIKNGDNSIGSMVVCNSSEQAKVLYQLFMQKYADPTELENETAEDGTTIYKSITPDAIELKKTKPAKDCYRAALVLYDSNDKETQKQWINLFKAGQLDIIIVYQMLQTGFDAPRLKKLYLNRVVKQHNLLQTLTRVNRPYKDMRFGYVVDFADIEDEYNRTNNAYQKEIEEEVGKENYKTFDQLFVSAMEVQERMKVNREILKDLDLANPQMFTQQLDLIDDRKQVLEIEHALEDVRDLENLITNQGDTPLLGFCIPEIQNLLKSVRQRLDFLNFQQGGDDIENKQELLNLALENIYFNFTLESSDELVLKEQYKEAVIRTKEQLKECIDVEDPRYRSLLEDFFSLFKNKKMEPNQNFNMKDRVQSLNEILKKVKFLNQQDAILALKYNNDKKFARVHKRLEDREYKEVAEHKEKDYFSWTNNKALLNDVLLSIKRDADDHVLHNRDAVDQGGWFDKLILSIVSTKLYEANIETERDARRYISNVIDREYQNEYKGY